MPVGQAGDNSSKIITNFRKSINTVATKINKQKYEIRFIVHSLKTLRRSKWSTTVMIGLLNKSKVRCNKYSIARRALI